MVEKSVLSIEFFSYFSMKTYVVGTYSKRLQMSTHNICFHGEIKKISTLELWLSVKFVYREDYKGYVQPYTPRFYNGWQPSPQVIEEVNRPGPSGSSVNRSFRQEEYRPVSAWLLRAIDIPLKAMHFFMLKEIRGVYCFWVVNPFIMLFLSASYLDD